MTNKVFIPELNKQYTLSENWSVTVDWRTENLKFLEMFKLTGMKETEYQTYGRTENDTYGLVTKVKRNVVANPLFKDDSGHYAPATVTVPKGSTFAVTLYKISNTYYEKYNFIKIKFSSSPKKNLKNRILVIRVADFNGAEVDEDQV